MSQKLSKLLMQTLEKNKILTYNNLYDIAYYNNISIFKLLKEIAILKRKNILKDVWIEYHDDNIKIMPYVTDEKGFIKNISNSLPLLSQNKINKLLS